VAEAGQAEATTMADKTLLRAPFAGVVSAKLANVGDTAMPGQALLVIEATDVLRFEAMVPEALARGLAPGRALPVRLDGAAADLTATVAEVSPTADATTRSLLVKLDLPRDPAVQAGRFGRLLLSSGDHEAVVVPPGAVVRRGQLETVFVADKDVARLRLVRTGRSASGAVEIVSGLAAGERVVVAEAAQLVDGQPIEVKP
jgi:RND family efflux transporter MFP subunit